MRDKVRFDDDDDGVPLDRFAGFEVAGICRAVRDLPGNEKSKQMPRTIYDFDIFVAPKVHALLDSQRKEDMAFVAGLQREANRKALEEITCRAAVHRAQNGAAINLNV